MKLTSKGKATRNRIIKGAATHLRSDEPGTMTLEDVQSITGTSRGQLFHYFPGGKEELLLAVARHEADQVLDDQQPHLGALRSWSAWERWRESVLARYRLQGANCPLGTLMDAVGNTPGAAEVSQSLLARWQGFIAAGVREMQAAGEITNDVDAERTAIAFITGIQGGVQMLRVTGSIDHLEAMFDVLLAHLRGTNLAPVTSPL
ncbi:TetR family transcriptional regulator C-terminal domain-containing protein [Actinomycetospora sp. NBRC 106375]|uniref:TetR/AcrR family transcriptional regulator n=1 Tax=Actinomycetospora sp. NBRC 106375 TaxID=3032207 RepID=UPI002552EFDF|nr:TetR family transcriptional regulator C-terminal domain-containing protein [Actinomycetospora sp. NBRC 106375]